MIKRLFDIIFSILGLIVLLPLFLVVTLLILIDSKGGAFFFQSRVGKNNRDFQMIKFRTMFSNSEKKGFLTVGNTDARITTIGRWLRRYKIDEFPQLLNILKGEMSFVGPRPEVRKYVDLYNDEQMSVLSVKQGLTDYASLEYIKENEILEQYDNPEEVYIEKIMPEKLALNIKYIKDKGFFTDLKIMLKTIQKIFTG
ncbi:MAG: sugar transferase [Deltaproteobacteria bacterium]|nr:MAG: sugar transferase [Deltaproteobacteria bacterium]